MASKCTEASSSDWPPDRKVTPGTAAGMVRDRATTVACKIMDEYDNDAFLCPIHIMSSYKEE
ncbi:hypothetical protein E2C01_019198 [Portunus trituberculatus]|uniref:Uncharacterized protein n=1 Tax=Portunus trituberculatus TaxID=210409 RepID=A0A5B7DX87_PORTR|nr:hypothetical protein [Portunus trituberculatus]